MLFWVRLGTNISYIIQFLYSLTVLLDIFCRDAPVLKLFLSNGQQLIMTDIKKFPTVFL